MIRMCSLALLLVVVVSGCQSVGQDPNRCWLTMTKPYVESEHSWCRGDGTGGIQGQAFYLSRGGAAVKVAGRYLMVMPDNPLNREYSSFRRECGDVKGYPHAAEPFRREVLTDADGRFEILGLPPGKYICAVDAWVYRQPIGFDPNASFHNSPRGQAAYWLFATVDVKDGEVASVLVTDTTR